MIPTGIEPIRAYRVWDIGNEQLWSLGMYMAWPGNTLQAECRGTYHRGDRIPSAECKCGVYARKEDDWDLSWLGHHLADGQQVMGEVDLWGHVIEGERGYRAEHARIVSLFDLSDDVHPIADVYGVPVVQAPEWAREGMAKPPSTRWSAVMTVRIAADVSAFDAAMKRMTEVMQQAANSMVTLTETFRPLMDAAASEPPTGPRDRLPKGTKTPEPYYRKGVRRGHRRD